MDTINTQWVWVEWVASPDWLKNRVSRVRSLKITTKRKLIRAFSTYNSLQYLITNILCAHNKGQITPKVVYEILGFKNFSDLSKICENFSGTFEDSLGLFQILRLPKFSRF